MKNRSTLQATLLVALLCSLHAAHGAETYTYDARGRLSSVTYTNGTSIYYAYDAAGNRTTSGPTAPAPPPTGTFTYVSSSHTAPGSGGDVASLVVQNTGTGAITGITYTCVGGGGFHTYGSSSASIAAGAQATYQCREEGGGAYTVAVTLTGYATNSPFAKTF